MQFSQENFSQEAALARLIEWFNEQTEEFRTIGANELLLIRVKVLTNSSGEPEFAVFTTTDPTLEDASRIYVGECVYTWVGVRGTPAVATEQTFYQLSKHVASTINVTGFVGTMIIEGDKEEPPIEAFVYRMDYGYTIDTGAYTSITVGINGNSNPEIQTDSWYMSGQVNLPNVSDVSVGKQYILARKTDGTVWGWGQHELVNWSNQPVQLPIDKPVRRIAALDDYCVVLYEDGTLEGFGNTYGLPPDHQESLPGSMYPSISNYSNVADIKAVRHIEAPFGLQDYYPQIVHQYIYILLNDGTVNVWGLTSTYPSREYAEVSYSGITSVNEYGYGMSDVKEVFGNHLVGVAHLNDGTVRLWGDTSWGYNMYRAPSHNHKVDVTKRGDIVLLPDESSALVYINFVDDNGFPSNEWSIWSFEVSAAVDISAGENHVAILHDDGNIRIVGHDGYGVYNYFVDATLNDVVQLFAGAGWTAALTGDKTLHWFKLEELAWA